MKRVVLTKPGEDPTTTIATILVLFLMVAVNSVVWWYTLPMLGVAFGKTVAVAYWQCVLLSLVPWLGKMAIPTLAVVWLASLFQ